MSPRRARAVSGLDGDPATALREHLIDVAERLLSERQVSAITTRDIARTAGVSDGVLYNYFADKNDLLLTALVRRYGRIVARFEADLPQPGTATVEAHGRRLQGGPGPAAPRRRRHPRPRSRRALPGAVVAGALGGLGDLVALDRQEQPDQLLAEQAAQHRVLLQLVQAASSRVGIGTGPSRP